MEKTDEELIENLIEKEPDLKNRVDEHWSLKEQLEEFNEKAYLTPQEKIEKKKIKKLKLHAKDKIEEILAKYRQVNMT